MTDLKPNGRIRLTAVLPADQLDAAADRLGKCLLSLGVYPSEVTVKAGDIDMTLHHANRPKAPKQLVSAKDLPVPRLELRWNSPEEAPPEGYPNGTQVCRYLLVIPLGKWDVRREDEDCEQVRDVHEVELGQTIRTGGFPNLVWPESQTVDTPYRAQSYAAWDSRALGLPAYATSGEQAMFIEPREPSA